MAENEIDATHTGDAKAESSGLRSAVLTFVNTCSRKKEGEEGDEDEDEDESGK